MLIQQCTKAVQAFAEVLPIHLLTEEKARMQIRIKKGQGGERETILKKLKEEWAKKAHREKSKWTKSIIPELKR